MSLPVPSLFFLSLPPSATLRPSWPRKFLVWPGEIIAPVVIDKRKPRVG